MPLSIIKSMALQKGMKSLPMPITSAGTGCFATVCTYGKDVGEEAGFLFSLSIISVTGLHGWAFGFYKESGICVKLQSGA